MHFARRISREYVPLCSSVTHFLRARLHLSYHLCTLLRRFIASRELYSKVPPGDASKKEREEALNGDFKKTWSTLACCGPPDAPLWLFSLGKSRNYVDIRANYINAFPRGMRKLSTKRLYVLLLYVYQVVTRVAILFERRRLARDFNEALS